MGKDGIPEFWVTITPMHEVAGVYRIHPDVYEMPEDVQFLSMYQSSSLVQAHGYFDFCVGKLGALQAEDLGWLDDLNQCLFPGDLVKVALYRVTGEVESLVEVVFSIGKAPKN